MDGEWQAPSDKEYNENGNHVIFVEKNPQTVYHSLELVRSILNSFSLSQNYPLINVENHYNSLVTISRGSTDRQQFKFLIAQPAFSSHYNYPIVQLPG